LEVPAGAARLDLLATDAAENPSLLIDLQRLPTEAGTDALLELEVSSSPEAAAESPAALLELERVAAYKGRRRNEASGKREEPANKGRRGNKTARRLELEPAANESRRRDETGGRLELEPAARLRVGWHQKQKREQNQQDNPELLHDNLLEKGRSITETECVALVTTLSPLAGRRHIGPALPG
jgi:hypothetical protein